MVWSYNSMCLSQQLRAKSNQTSPLPTKPEKIHNRKQQCIDLWTPCKSFKCSTILTLVKIQLSNNEVHLSSSKSLKNQSRRILTEKSLIYSVGQMLTCLNMTDWWLLRTPAKTNSKGAKSDNFHWFFFLNHCWQWRVYTTVLLTKLCRTVRSVHLKYFKYRYRWIEVEYPTGTFPFNWWSVTVRLGDNYMRFTNNRDGFAVKWLRSLFIVFFCKR